ncbi:MAG: ornithine carbamoyltransferase [Candidatus Methanomethylicia archaeon]|jgi:ornithine carbamoyltransferase|nr:ornithine carbamoyltransferase [Candidatus Methanomethylicia archaeon]
MRCNVRSMKGRDLLTLSNFTREEIKEILKLASEMKYLLKSGKYVIPYLNGKSIFLLFQKPSTRTRLSFEVAIHQLGGFPIYINWNELQIIRGESLEDTVRAINAYCDAIVARVYKHSDLETIADISRIPVINALSDLAHPCQALADCLTIIEKKGKIEDMNVVFIGDGNNNVCRSLSEAVLKLGGNMIIVSPKKYQIDPSYAEFIKKNAYKNSSLILTDNPIEGVKEADVIYTDVWISMGQESESEERMREFKKYQVNSELLSFAPNDVIIMHCLPAHRGLEITDDVIDGKNSVVWDQAENRLHVQKAILTLLV